MAKKRILWISRHPPVQEETDELRLLLGEHTVTIIPGVDHGADSIDKMLDEHPPDQVVAILPLSLVEVLLVRLKQRGMPRPWRPAWQHRRKYGDQGANAPDVFQGFDEILEMRYRKRRLNSNKEGA